MGIKGASFSLSFFFSSLYFLKVVSTIFSKEFSQVFFFPSLEVVVLVFFSVMHEMGIKDASFFSSTF